MLIGEYESLSVFQRGVFSLVSQEVSELCGGESAPVARVMPEDGIQLWATQQLPAELLDLGVIQAAVVRSVAPLRFKGKEQTVRKVGETRLF